MESATISNIASEQDGGVLTIRFDRPEKKNALTLAMYRQVLALLKEGAADPTVAVVVITGNGLAFSAGNDLGDFLNAPPIDESSDVFQLLLLLVDYAKPVIAAVNGVAVGFGTTLLLHCDLVLAGASARFSLPFVSLGLVPEAASSLLLPRAAGMARASELLLLGEPFDAQAAKEAGIVCEVVPDAELAARTRSRAEAFAARPPEALAAAKKLLRDPVREEIRATIKREAEVFRARLVSAEAREAFSAFLEKRPAVYRR